ncbi:ABC transporter ATP-binding protein [Vibrio comitans]|uniref:sn-glycerol-3-phosphate import ATP-binding protein UgpC 2 n=1 Tax=Vibrio comitans NBRC 102076 TaxID=1219078 RepID=A0A4Y3ILZ2_9VIBR|nr:sn-glycerol-3-phosphate ABC transporter ATP-binding protein UgpC [Vibrio comitans]GEA60145.1 sn-glycerol-3-phosphate import ATP-binding protein UgpC 2 [Vibrio comitans NBRC 102076]
MSNLLNSIRDHAEGISLKNIKKSYGTNTVIENLSIDIKAGEFIVILGPSGCGKSTTMNIIAGLEESDSGTIHIGDREVQDLEPKKRGCAMVFQNYALYPHMTVADNIGYSLKIQGLKKQQRRERVEEVAKVVSLGSYLERQPSELSGGQRQRVAIGRAIVREPSVLLFDEPLSNLDAKLRQEMRMELSQLHSRIGSTSIFVTHDQIEAMTLADRIIILNGGHLEQFDTPSKIYEKPASTFVANFIGSPAMNLFDMTPTTSVYMNDLEPDCIEENTIVGIRPEHIEISESHGELTTVKYMEDLGSHKVVTVVLTSGEELLVATQLGQYIQINNRIRIFFPAEKLHFFDKTTNKRKEINLKITVAE